MESKTFKYNDLSEWDKTFLQSLSLYERHSKCAAKNVACILTKDNNILSIGINGTLQGKTNCNELFKKSSNKWFKKDADNEWIEAKNGEHSKWSLLNEIHAEMNAIKKASQNNGFNLDGATAYVSYSPCFNCAKMLVLFGIRRIVFREAYDDINEVSEFLKENEIEFIRGWKDNKYDEETLLELVFLFSLRLGKNVPQFM